MSTANSFISKPLPIGSLIIDRLCVLDLGRGSLVRQAGQVMVGNSFHPAP
jgi:hypothetical protein